MKVFADMHHGALYASLQMLFEGRMGASLYRPIGLEWFERGYWYIWNHIDTARQYLALDQATADIRDCYGVPLLPHYKMNNELVLEDGIFYAKDSLYRTVHKSITLDKFIDTKFDILIASIPQHIGPFLELQRLYQPQAKVIFQAGNAWSPDPRVKNFMGSIAPCSVPTGVNAVFYHQEMNLDDFRYERPVNKTSVSSFVHYMGGKPRMNQLATQLPDWAFRSYGAGMDIDTVAKMSALGDVMRETAFIFHDKPGADGFGHSIHAAFSVGRPVICSTSQYAGKLAGSLMLHNSTCIDMDRFRSPAEIAARLREIVATDEHEKMCEAAAARFREVVDYDREFEEIKQFLDRLQ